MNETRIKINRTTIGKIEELLESLQKHNPDFNTEIRQVFSQVDELEQMLNTPLESDE